MADPGAPDLFEQILGAPDRDRCPGARPVVSWRDDDEPRYLEAIEARSTFRVALHRRGIWHGNLAELEPEEVDTVPAGARLAERWHGARPIALPSLVDPAVWAPELAERRRLHDELKEPGGLRRFLQSRRALLEPEYQLQGRPARLEDPERDIERELLAWSDDPSGRGAARAKDLWLKSSWLSTREEDESLRLRLSFGREVIDDASRDLPRHLRVRELAELLLPETRAVHEHPELPHRLAGLVGGEVFFSQHIAYWNGPDGGALFHHDAFAESVEGGQRGVLYVQLTGRTAWLALSIEDLARRVIELGEYLEEGALPWVRQQLFRGPEDFVRFRKACARFPRIRRELARPGCGELGRLVNRGPEFTGLLADAGHAYVLHPGDAIVLPNHGYERTAMHSVFCAGELPAYGLSMAIRERHPPEPVLPPEPPPAGKRGHGGLNGLGQRGRDRR